MKARKIKVGAVHAAAVYTNKNETLQKVVSLIEEAGKRNIELLAFPEVFIPGFHVRTTSLPCGDHPNSIQYFINSHSPPAQVPAIIEYTQQSVIVSASGGDLATVRAACKESEVGIVLGISEGVAGGHQLFNSLLFIDSSGTLLGTHRKLRPTYAERYVWSQGSGHTLRTYDFSRNESENEQFSVGGLCCWENTMNLARQSLIESGHQISAAAWPALSTTGGFEAVAHIQIEALAKNHALTG